MKTSGLVERYAEEIEGVLGCFDRVVVTGTLREISHPDALAGRLRHEGIRCFDLGQFADPLRQKVCDQAKTVAREAGVEIQFLARSKGVRKEELIGAVLAKRGHREPGLVHVLSVMEACTTFKPWHDKVTGRTGLKMAPGRCLTFYFYLIDEVLGLMDVRVPAWLPCRLQIYFNGHHALANQLREAGIDYQMQDNAFVHIGDWAKAQELARTLAVGRWEAKFHAWAKRFCPVVETFRGGSYWTAMQVEYALDVIFKKRETLAPLYEEISRQAVLAVRVGDMARFWGKHYSPEAEAQSDFKTLVEGTRIKHALGRQSLKMDDKGRVLRIEATSNDITFFRHHRKVVHRDGREEYKNAALKKSIYSLSDVGPILHAACLRYLDFVGALEDTTPGRRDLDKISRPVRDDKARSWRGFNLFLKEDQSVILAILRGEFVINGLSNARLRALLPQKSSSAIARILGRLRKHGLLKKVAHGYRYYLTHLGQRLLVAARKLFEHVIVPNLQPLPA